MLAKPTNGYCIGPSVEDNARIRMGLNAPTYGAHKEHRPFSLIGVITIFPMAVATFGSWQQVKYSHKFLRKNFTRFDPKIHKRYKGIFHYPKFYSK